MANVAAAIERESKPKGQANFWWDSYVSLFHALDKCFASDSSLSAEPNLHIVSQGDLRQNLDREAFLAELFRSHHQGLLNSLQMFRPPNVTSKAALNAPQLSVGSHNLKVTSELRDLALRASAMLELDEIQSYILVSQISQPKFSSLSLADGERLSAVVTDYYMERLSLLKSARLILTCRMAEDKSNAGSSQAITEEVTNLLEEGFEDHVLSSLTHLLSSVQPQQLDRRYANAWAEEAAQELTLLLDILFLLYYEPLCICTFAKLKGLVDIFEGLVVSKYGGEILALTSETEKLLQHAKQQAVLLIIEALDLESVLMKVHSDTPFSQSESTLSVEEVQQLDAILSTLDLETTVECGPILLAWGTFLCLLSYLAPADERAAFGYFDHTVYIRQAHGAGAYNYLLNMLRDDFFQDFDVQLGGYKSVIKTLVSAFLAAYDSTTQINNDGHDVIIDILCELYRGQESLCSELWDRDSVIDGPIRSLLFALRDFFPFQTSHLLRLLAAQCEGAWPAECVYEFLYQCVEVTCPYQRNEQDVTSGTNTVVQTSKVLHVPDAPGLFIPAGTVGSILTELSEDIWLVRWECKHSAMIVLLLRLLRRSTKSDHLEDAQATLSLLNRMLTANKALSQPLLDLNTSVVAAAARADGRMANSLKIDAVNLICSVINAVVQVSGSDALIASCMGILTSLSMSCPKQVMTELGLSILLRPPVDDSVAKAFPGSQLHELIVKAEESTGRFPLTNAVLDFTKAMVDKGIPDATHSSGFVPLVTHVIGNVFVNHGHWKYQQWHERLMITTKGIWVMRSIIAGIRRGSNVGSVKGVVDLMLYDSIVQDVLIGVLSVSAQELEELHFSHAVGAKEIEWLQEALYSVLMLIHDLAVEVTVGTCCKDYTGVTLENSLFRKTTGNLPVVTAIASYLSFSRNAKLQFASAKAFTSLILLAQRSRSNPSGIADFISSAEQKMMIRKAIGNILSDDNALSNRPLIEAVIDLLSGAVRWQSALVELLLFPSEQVTVESETQRNGIGASITPTGSRAVWTTEVVDILWKWVAKSSTVSKSHPQIFSRVLFLLAAIWEGGVEYIRIIDAFRSKPQFWDRLSSFLSFHFSSSSQTLLSEITVNLDPETPLASGLSESQFLSYSFKYSCEASVLSIMTRDIFLQQHLTQTSTMEPHRTTRQEAVTGNKEYAVEKIHDKDSNLKSKNPSASGAVAVVLNWFKGSHISTIMRSYAVCLYDNEAILRAKAEARILVVGLMGKILASDIQGLNVSLTRRLRDATSQMTSHPAFEELSEQYSSRGYSHGEYLQAMLINDLCHHLQGELNGGRPIPPGSFQHMADFLVSSDVDRLLIPVVSGQLPDLHPSYGDAFIYDAAALEAELGLSWWGNAILDTVTSQAAGKTLEWIHRANAMASLGHAQLSALRSWSALLTVSVFNKHEAQGGLSVPAADWTEDKLMNYSTELCVALEGVLTAIGPLGDPTNFIPDFITWQGQILLVFVRWLIHLEEAASQEMYIWVVCSRLVSSVVSCLKKLLESHGTWHQQIQDLIKSFFGALLLLLELMHSQKTRADGEYGSSEFVGQRIGHAFADVTLVGLSFLPSLCRAAEKIEFANVAIAVINVLIKSYLAPSTWFPILQVHFPLAISLARMHEDPNKGNTSKVMLNFCLAFVRLKSGAEFLHSAGFFSQLQMLNLALNEEMPFSSVNEGGPFSVWWKRGGQHGGIWSLGIAVAAGLVRSIGDKDPSGTVIQNAMTYIQLQKDRMVGALRAPIPSLDSQGRKKVKTHRPRTTLAALRDTQHVIALMCEVFHHQVPWTLRNSVFDFGEVVVHLLAFIAREGHQGGSIRNATVFGFGCQPLHKDEIAAHSRPAVVNSNCGWFAVTAKGCLPGDVLQSLRPQSPSRSASPSRTLSPSWRGSLSPSNSMGSGGLGCVRASEYSNTVAIHIYKLAYLLLRYLCQEVHHATRRVEEGGPPDYSQCPELPAPEILHGLQDQILPVVTEICGGRGPNGTAQDVCLLLLSVLEMTLYLEVFIAKTCNVGPLPLRKDDFIKEYKAMFQGYAHAFLELSLQSLTRIMSSAHPDVI